LVLFSVAITAITFIERWWSGKIKLKEFIISGVASGAVAILSWWTLGNFILDGNDSKAGGFGEFSTNLNTFWNPKIDTPFLNHKTDYFAGQYEGIAYLGIGILLLILLTGVLLLLRKIKFEVSKRNILLGATSFVFFFFSLSHIISYGDQLVFEIPYSKYLINKFATLRASGRYVWLLQYLLILIPIIGLYKTKWNANLKTAILLIVFGLNIIDFQYYFELNKAFQFKIEPIPNFDKASFEKVISQGEEVIMYPPHSRTYHSACDETPFISIAAFQTKPINTGHLARKNDQLRKEYLSFLHQKIDHDHDYFLNKVVITLPNFADLFKTLTDNDVSEIFVINNFLAYVPKRENTLSSGLKSISKRDSINYKKENFQDFLVRNKSYNWAIAVKDDAMVHLDYCSEWKQYFEKINSNCTKLNFRESYIGLIQKEKLISEQFGRDQKNGVLSYKNMLEGITVEIMSASMDYGNTASIKINGNEQAIDDRGFNIVVFDNEGAIIESTVFDTFKQCHHNSENTTNSFPVWKVNPQ